MCANMASLTSEKVPLTMLLKGNTNTAVSLHHLLLHHRLLHLHHRPAAVLTAS